MPIYEYVCSNCRSEFELLIRNGQTPQCPQCNGQQLEKQFSVVAAPITAEKSLPICPTTHRGCGRPQCGSGGCQWGDD